VAETSSILPDVRLGSLSDLRSVQTDVRSAAASDTGGQGGQQRALPPQSIDSSAPVNMLPEKSAKIVESTPSPSCWEPSLRKGWGSDSAWPPARQRIFHSWSGQGFEPKEPQNTLAQVLLGGVIGLLDSMECVAAKSSMRAKFILRKQRSQMSQKALRHPVWRRWSAYPWDLEEVGITEKAFFEKSRW